MGHVAHHAIIVTGWDENLVERAHAIATETFDNVTPIAGSYVNGYRSFLVAPAGSKEGWTESDDGDDRREKFKAAMLEHPFVEPGEDGPCAMIAWVEVHYNTLAPWTAVIADGDPRNRPGDT